MVGLVLAEHHLQGFFLAAAEVLRKMFLAQAQVVQVVLEVVDEEQQELLIPHQLRERQILAAAEVAAKILINLLHQAALVLSSSNTPCKHKV
jgi:hypothetical protein